MNKLEMLGVLGVGAAAFGATVVGLDLLEKKMNEDREEISETTYADTLYDMYSFQQQIFAENNLDGVE
ncbi:MAG: hypothetical protein IJ733_18860 [Lachnospiraceae bacterium]|nr:hypothetical protein [Lachnospiraceae bacterium]